MEGDTEPGTRQLAPDERNSGMTAFRILRPFNQDHLRRAAGSKSRIGRNWFPEFPGDNLIERLVRALAEERALPIKEVTEAFEFFAVTRKYVRREVIVDLCCGHGLAGILFAAIERRTCEVLLCDRRRPDHFEHVWRATTRVAPWIEDKVRFVEGDLLDTRENLPPKSGVLGVHACGAKTDLCLEIAADLGGPVAVMPCCRDHSHSGAPQGLSAALGADVAYDVHRTYEMEANGYRVRWREIPSAITPMNRVLIGVPR
jgi:hypothetical protein